MHAVGALSEGKPHHIDFLHPITSALLAAAHSNSLLKLCPLYSPDANSYAHTVGLKRFIEDGEMPIARRGYGRYTPLATVAMAVDVDTANAVLSETIAQCLRHVDATASNDICNVLGELHDNIASHAHGRGFSAAQVYQKKVCNFAVVDGGRGLYASTRTAAPQLRTHAEALDWCLKKGNTGVVAVDSWAQSLPEDSMFSAYPTSVPTRRSQNHHMGEGLWRLGLLVSQFGGQLWLCTGDASMVFDHRGLTSVPCWLRWKGFAVEGSVPFAPRRQPVNVSQLDELARRLGL